MKSGGQAWALEQLDEIAARSNGALELVEIVEPAEEGGAVRVWVSVDCSSYAKTEAGIPFRPRERLLIAIEPQFPLDIPTLHFTHSEYGGFPHVQWGTYICLYLSPEAEWQPDDGMFGFVQRMDDWLRAGAANLLEPIGLPMHPPVAYASGQTPAVVPTQNTPSPEPPWWAGYAKIVRENDVCMELGEWLTLGSDIPMDTRVAPAILLPGDMPFEYPPTIATLKNVLAERGIPIETVRLMLTAGALRNPDNKALVFILGAAMRGITGGERKQHLAAWCVSADQALALRTATLAATEENALDEQLFLEWTKTARIDWCPVLEDRPEIITQRDTGTPAEYWRGRNIAILGCGAIGSIAAMLLARAGAGKLQLYDKALVKPGLLVRQIFDRHQIGFNKARATRTNVQYINPDIETVAHSKNILNVLQSAEQRGVLFGVDVIIDATASIRVASALEQGVREWPKNHPPLASMAVGFKADTALMTLARPAVAGAGYDLDRRFKLELTNSANGKHFLDEFWPPKGQVSRLFQPEPGCSDPTFVGSAADLANLVARMLNVVSGWLGKGTPDVSHGFAVHVSAAPQIKADRPHEVEFSWQSDSVLADPRHGYQIRLSPEAEAAVLGWMRKSVRQRGPDVETGGVLFGQIDRFLKVIWVSSVGGPPPDSTATRNGFVCGTRGVAEMNRALTRKSQGAVSFIGMWHTHPGGTPDPSPIDREAMERLFAGNDFRGRHFLMLIVGGSANSPIIAGSLFDRDE